MTLGSWLIYGITATISLFPVFRSDLLAVHPRYRYFRYTSWVLLIWTVLTGIRYLVQEAWTLYIISLFIYPLVFLATFFVFVALMTYLEKTVPKSIFIALGVFFFIDLIVSLTNEWHFGLLEIAYSNTVTYEQLFEAEHGWFFFIHTAGCYSLLFVTMYQTVRRLYHDLKEDQDIIPFTIMVVSIAIGLVANIIHLFVYAFIIDPTYVVFVNMMMVLYFIFYIRDVKMIIHSHANEFILENLREMYLIVDQKGLIVDASDELITQFKVDPNAKMTFEAFKRQMSDYAIIYTHPEELVDSFDSTKRYLHMMEKPINLPFFKYSGLFYLFYDETNTEKYINDLEYVMNHDLMTGLYNRNYLESMNELFVTENDQLSLMMLDVDGLKIMNDYLGHAMGDDLLKRFAQALKTLRIQYPTITPIRMGGDEFLIVIPSETESQIEAIVQSLTQLTVDTDKMINIGFSYGIASKQNSFKTMSQLLSQADQQLYKMKVDRQDEKEEFRQALETYLKQQN